jgi:sugar phosphate isomerase/epimerase
MKLSAFADEISADLDEQIQALRENAVTHVELRGVENKNVLDFDKPLRQRIKSALAANGLGVIGIGSPIGKVKITDPWEPHFERFKIAVELAEFFAAPFVRIFSYYPPQPGQDMTPFRQEILRRTRAKVDYVKNRNVMLVHENEKDIYGETGKACLDLLTSMDSPKYKLAFDFANFVQAHEHPLEIWPSLKPFTVHIHVKDARLSDGVVLPAGQGDGQIAPILVDLHKSGYDGFLSLEPHLKVAGHSGGFSGPQLFKQAADALKALCRKNNIPLAGA